MLESVTKSILASAEQQLRRNVTKNTLCSHFYTCRTVRFDLLAHLETSQVASYQQHISCTYYCHCLHSAFQNLSHWQREREREGLKRPHQLYEWRARVPAVSFSQHAALRAQGDNLIICLDQSEGKASNLSRVIQRGTLLVWVMCFLMWLLTRDGLRLPPSPHLFALIRLQTLMNCPSATVIVLWSPIDFTRIWKVYKLRSRLKSHFTCMSPWRPIQMFMWRFVI